jgi:hypothetical protein
LIPRHASPPRSISCPCPSLAIRFALFGSAAVVLTLAWSLLFPVSTQAGAYFEDGYLGLTQAELRAKLGPPQSVRDRKAALRVFNYYSFADWEKFYKKLVSPQNGEDVYNYQRDGVTIRYSFGYVTDLADSSDEPPLFVSLVDIEFSPAFRSNVWLLLFKGPPSSDARFIVREKAREQLDWSLAFQMFTLQGLPEFLTLNAPIDRMEIGAQSIQLVKQRQRLTHEPIMNPFSQEFARQAPPPPPTKKVPVPKYAE